MGAKWGRPPAVQIHATPQIIGNLCAKFYAKPLNWADFVLEMAQIADGRHLAEILALGMAWSVGARATKKRRYLAGRLPQLAGFARAFSDYFCSFLLSFAPKSKLESTAINSSKLRKSRRSLVECGLKMLGPMEAISRHFSRKKPHSSPA